MSAMNSEVVDKYPHDFDVEYALLGWIVSNNRVMTDIGFLRGEDFYSAQHGEIFSAMADLYAKGQDITPFTLKTIVLHEFPEGGLFGYLSGAMSATMLYPWPVEQAKYLKKLSQKRRLVAACETAMSLASNDQATADDQIATLTRAIEDVSFNSPLNEFQNCYEVGEAIMQELKTEIVPHSTGFDRLDKAMGGGLYMGKSYGFAARKKVGKTTLAASISANLNRSSIKHAFLAFEMSPQEIHQRVLAKEADIYVSSFRTSYGQSLDCQKKLASTICSMPKNILYKGCPGMVFDDLRRVATVAVDRYKVQGLIIDYWQLIGGKRKGQSTAEHLDEVAQWIADFGRKNGIWTLTMAQINQEGNTRGGEGIRLAFDQVYEIHREDVAQPETWIEMMETRYTPWMNIGSKEDPKMFMAEKGGYFGEYK
jgi:replicative DNA helicase